MRPASSTGSRTRSGGTTGRPARRGKRRSSMAATRRGRSGSSAPRVTRRSPWRRRSRARGTTRCAASTTSSSRPPRRRTPPRSRRACTVRSSRAASSSGKRLPRTPSRSSGASAPDPFGLTLRPGGVCFPEHGSPRGLVERRHLWKACSTAGAAHMQEAIQQTTTFAEANVSLAAAAYRAEAWAGEPFLHEGEDPPQVLAPGTARRRALDDALAEIDAGRQRPSPQWKVRYGLMLGLERVLADPEPHTATGTPLRRHQIDALAGMLTELIAAAQREEEANGNGHAAGDELTEPEPDEDEDDDALSEGDDEVEEEGLTPEQDPGAIRRYRFRYPTASGKTIAAAGFVAAARTLGVLILTHRRLLVSQFER